MVDERKYKEFPEKSQAMARSLAHFQILNYKGTIHVERTHRVHPNGLPKDLTTTK